MRYNFIFRDPFGEKRTALIEGVSFESCYIVFKTRFGADSTILRIESDYL